MPAHTLKISPVDVLFFRDGRPMEGSSAGHGAAWPHPHVLDAALHHALRRAGLPEVHRHQVARNGVVLSSDRDAHGREFGSLQTAGPFPISPDGEWYFPRPADATIAGSSKTTHAPLGQTIPGAANSLPGSMLPVVSSAPPSKDSAEKWLNIPAFEAYLNSQPVQAESRFVQDRDLFAAEHQVGIGIDPDTATQDGKSFYSASYLRLRTDWSLGIIASCMDKGRDGREAKQDLIAATFFNSGQRTSILVGGQQRSATVLCETPSRMPLPIGPTIQGTRVRWTLLTPAIFPHIPENPDKKIPAHPGGWLPTWVDASHRVQLKDPGASQRRQGESRYAWRARVAALSAIGASLVAAQLNGRALPITGWALHDTHEETHALILTGGAKSTHLAVPAGSVYYFECDSEDAAQKLANSLNWHGDTPGTVICNRRSTLMGEKGFGLGVCGTW